MNVPLKGQRPSDAQFGVVIVKGADYGRIEGEIPS